METNVLELWVTKGLLASWVLHRTSRTLYGAGKAGTKTNVREVVPGIFSTTQSDPSTVIRAAILRKLLHDPEITIQAR